MLDISHNSIKGYTSLLARYVYVYFLGLPDPSNGAAGDDELAVNKEDAGDRVRLEHCPQQNQLPTVSLHKRISYLSGLCSAKDLTIRGRYTLLLCSAETVLRMMSQLPAAAAMLSGSEDTTNLKQ